MIEIRWHGRGGQGSFTASRILGAAASLYGNKYALAFPSFGPERRGAPITAFTKIDDQKIRDRSEIIHCDYIVVLDETLFAPSLLQDLKPGGKILINTAREEKYKAISPDWIVTFDAVAIAQEILGRPVTNTAMIGALIGISEVIPVHAVAESIKNEFSSSLAEKNIRVLNQSYERIKGEWL
ncbi:MAG: pyruvate ferredoxin oxidoreductase gamma subunit [Epulopiscium sp.]|uniref:Pyruvate ferredoxin oxidoreductase n=1 Tax=Defluviitalea raffinosedens TaxID=1450156 RepID=A0A7C8LI65_9FIRM|nr:2-oxoacid:acceptor oxidoreductase family protein [Defluviitalea raffinosedens]MBZ4666958.1 2-oxoacid:acceptor oxidoreductase, gamma subunit, pyruvate/2-ketoisovalerate family [Defluviitaleaceae bacterium]MDK2786863.1 pyruvate ferredoxin oxidoreductase gamma subunit [Candidatus Epulonipiscium sp.]KAE9636176.1 pyruvate ferredoxin oxidoreductase [Defluviitalea raffinosedens]MBM7684970.1 pyruvate ferredoxin oxidoreductase gamma subunit [Defluviitalea raffinosedens]HHW68670.1 pyruvate ferredoxin